MFIKPQLAPVNGGDDLGAPSVPCAVQAAASRASPLTGLITGRRSAKFPRRR